VITVREVTSRADFKKFVAFPYDLYRGDRLWVPYLRSEVEYLFSAKNPFWLHAERALYLALDGERVVGRVAAIKDDELVTFRTEREGVFGFYESVNDAAVGRALYGAAEDWLRSRGMTRLVGPMNPSTNEECGFLLEGFETPPYIMMTHTPPYYLGLAEGCGYEKAMDLQAWLAPITERNLARLDRVAAGVRRRWPELELRHVDVKRFAEEVELVRQIYNRAWEDNWGFVPATPAEFDDVAKRLKSLVEPKLVWLATVGADPAGFVMAIPNYNEVLAKMGGSMNPISIIKFITGKKKIKGIRLMLFGVCKEYRQRGIDACLMYESNKAALALGFKEVEFSWVLEGNEMTNRAASMMGGRVYKNYRIYTKDL